jgi:multidrug efflux pump subunit AcrB
VIVTDFALRRRSAVFVFALMAVILGALSYFALPRESFPDITIPVITVHTTYRGVSPEDIENTITMPIERKLRGLSDVREVRSASAEGESRITIQFLSTVNIDAAMQKVRDKIEQAKPDLPEDAEEPVLAEINLSELPILTIALAGDVGPVKLKQAAEDLADRIETVAGVLDARVVGGRTREVHVEIDPDKFTGHKLSFTDVLTLIGRENQNVSGGSVETGPVRFQVRVPGQFTDPRQIEELVLASHDAKPVYLRALARVADGFRDRATTSRLDGRENVTIQVQKRSGENVPAIAAGVKKVLAGATDLLGPRITWKITSDHSDDIRMMVSDLENNILSGLILVVAVIFSFMGFRNSLLVAAALPLSMLITFTALEMLGLNLNMIVLFSLILSLGMLVDNASTCRRDCRAWRRP